MTDERNGVERGVSRRRLLRVAGAGAGAAAIGLAGTAGTAAADACPRPPDHWADSDWPDTAGVRDPMTVAGEERDVAVWRLLLAGSPDDPGRMMARQLVAARLNFQHRYRDDPTCVDQPLSAYDGRTIRELRASARRWLAASGWPAAQDDWTVGPVDGEPLWAALAAFNHTHLDLEDCSCVPAGRDDREPPAAAVRIVDGTAADDGRTAGETDAAADGSGRRDRSRRGSGPTPLPRVPRR